MSKIIDIEIIDLRVPTSDTLQGSDPFHKKPNYSCVLTRINTDDGLLGLSVNFSAGAGNDWLAYGVRDLSRLILGRDLEEFIGDPISFYRLLIDHHQLRWLADGVARMAIGSILNALWDLWAKTENKPLWKLLVDLPPERIVHSIDWRYLKDALTPEEALERLKNARSKRTAQEKHVIQKGVKAYSTAGWLGLTDQEILETIEDVRAQGLDCFKMKVGGGIDFDRKRMAFLRESIGDEALLMTDANQIWGVDEAIEYMKRLSEFRPYWIEEPTARDDVFGYKRIADDLRPFGIGVAAGEQVPSPVIFKQLLMQNAIQYCQIDATRLAGVQDVLAVILMADKFQIPVCPHGGGIGLCNMIVHYAIWDQICVSGPSRGQLVEYLYFLQDEVFLDPVSIRNGAYEIPTSGGWGLEMEEEFVREHTYPTGRVWQGREDSGSITFIA